MVCIFASIDCQRHKVGPFAFFAVFCQILESQCQRSCVIAYPYFLCINFGRAQAVGGNSRKCLMVICVRSPVCIIKYVISSYSCYNVFIIYMTAPELIPRLELSGSVAILLSVQVCAWKPLYRCRKPIIAVTAVNGHDQVFLLGTGI